MTDKDTITLPRKHIDYAAHALEHFNKDAPDPLVSEIIHHLRTALAAEQPKVSVTLNPDAMRTVSSGDAVLAASSVAVTVSSALAAEQPKHDLMKWAKDAGSSPEDLERFAAYTIATRDMEIATLREENEALRRDAERYKWVLNWLWRYGLLSREKTRIDTPESYGDWFVLRKPHIIDGGSLIGYGKTEDAAIDAAMGDKR